MYKKIEWFDVSKIKLGSICIHRDQMSIKEAHLNLILDYISKLLIYISSIYAKDYYGVIFKLYSSF